MTLRYKSKLLHLGVGRAHTGRRVLLLVHDRDVRVITEDGELLQHLTIDPTKTYQAQGQSLELSRMSRDSCPGAFKGSLQSAR